MQTWAPPCEVKQRWAPFLPGLSGLLLRYSANQNFWGCACNPCTPSSNTTAFHNSIIGNFIIYQQRLETNLLQLLRLESPRGKCAKLQTVAASNNRDHSIIALSRHVYMGVVLRAHPVRGESHIQRNANGEVATQLFRHPENPE